MSRPMSRPMSRSTSRLAKLVLAVSLVLGLSQLTSGASVIRAQTNAPATLPCNRVEWIFIAGSLCLETVVADLDTAGVVSIGGLAFDAEGTLYFTRPALRAIWRASVAVTGQVGVPEPFITDLPEMPFGLTFDPISGAWFVGADSMIFRVDADRTVTTIVRGLPSGTGGWLGDLKIGADRRLYVAKAAECDACDPQSPQRGALLSMALDGSDMRVVARGLRDSFGFDWVGGDLYIVDNERETFPAELNVIRAGQQDLDFGYPRCAGNRESALPANDPSASSAACDKTVAPLVLFDRASHPTGVLAYRGSAIPELTGGLVVVFAGSWNSTSIAGYELLTLRGLATPSPTIERVIPFSNRSTANAALNKTTFHPYNLYALAESAEGWVYLSVAQGRIYRLRPAPQSTP